MFKVITKFFSKQQKNNPTKKILLTLLIIFIFRFGNAIPLSGIDEDALKKSFSQLENRNAIMQIINMYSGAGSSTLLSPFSLGIIPYINSSILVDLLTTLVPSLEKLQSEEGEYGRRKLLFYKKLVTLIFAIGQSILLIFYLKPYFYNTDFFTFFVTGLQLVAGSMSMVWLSNLIDNRGLGNGTSLIIFTNIIVTFLNTNVFNFNSITPLLFLDIIFLLFVVILITITQTATVNIDVVSARQLTFLQKDKERTSDNSDEISEQLKNNGLIIKLNQAGIFPIIIASNLLGFLSYLTQSISFPYINTIIYYLLIIGFNYFYTIVFWDPDKIAEQLRKASVSLVDITPGKRTAAHLEKIVRSTSLVGGLALCIILLLYDSFKQITNSSLLNQINITSLIILVGVAYDLQKTVRGLYRNMIFS